MQTMVLDDSFYCNICSHDITNRYNITFCPRCMNGYHTDHLASWVMTNDEICPTCESQLDELLVRELKPRSGIERKKLEVMNYLCAPNRKQTTMINSGIIPKLKKLASIYLINIPTATRKHNAA